MVYWNRQELALPLFLCSCYLECMELFRASRQKIVGTRSPIIRRKSKGDTQAAVTNERAFQIAKVFLRLSLAVTFLVAIADRFGWLGPYGSKNVSWGDWKHSVQYVAVLNWFV